MLRQLLTSDGLYKNFLAVIRAIAGIIIAKYGLEVFKADGMKGNFDWLTDLHMPAPHFMAYLGKLTELIGGGLLAIGLFTRLVTIPLIINMGVIIFLWARAISGATSNCRSCYYFFSPFSSSPAQVSGASIIGCSTGKIKAESDFSCQFVVGS